MKVTRSCPTVAAVEAAMVSLMLAAIGVVEGQTIPSFTFRTFDGTDRPDNFGKANSQLIRLAPANEMEMFDANYGGLQRSWSLGELPRLRGRQRQIFIFLPKPALQPWWRH